MTDAVDGGTLAAAPTGSDFSIRSPCVGRDRRSGTTARRARRRRAPTRCPTPPIGSSALPAPAVEVAERRRRDAAFGRPHGEPRAGGVGVGAEAVVQVAVGALVEEVQVELADGVDGGFGCRHGVPPAGAVGEQFDAPADVAVTEHVGGRPGQAPAPRRRQHPAGHVVRRGLAEQVVEVGDDEVGVAGGEPLERGVEHVGRRRRRPGGRRRRRAGGGSRRRSPVASPLKAAANAGMSWVRMPATERAGIGGRRVGWYRLNCSSYSPTTSQRASASLTSSGTVPRFSPTIVVAVRVASAAITASSSSRG